MVTKKEPPGGVLCYWEWDNDEWVLMESFPVDGDGYPMTVASTHNYSNHRHQWNGWLFQDGDEDETTNLLWAVLSLPGIWRMGYAL